MKVLIALGVIVVIVGIWLWGSYNGLVSVDNQVDKAWADVEASYQRRLDTIPKFVKTAQFSADFQIKLISEYTKYREGVRDAAVSGNPDSLQKIANDGYNALVIAVRAEAVPQAKTDQLTELNAQVENVERVINHERKAYNDSVMRYENKRERFPGSIVAGMFGFGPRQPFKAEEGAEKSPDFEFQLK